jgi:hypothetical protein
MVASPDNYLFRVLTRMGTMERPLPGPAWQIFFSNVGKALAMFSWSDGNVWVISIPEYPALGVIAGALFYIGLALVLIRYLRRKNWLDLFLLLSIPLLMLPSTLSLAFPDENPNLYRTGGALVPVFLMVGIGLDGLMTAFTSRLSSAWGKRLAYGLVVVLVGLASFQDYDLVFNQFCRQYEQSAWNTSEMGQVVQGFVSSIGNPDNAWVMSYPYWVDTRLVAINAGFPGRDFELFAQSTDHPEKQLDATKSKSGPKLFIVNKEDKVSISALTITYPLGWFQTYASKEIGDKNFLIYFVPSQAGSK